MTSLTVATTLPFAWSPASAGEPAPDAGNSALMRVVNLSDLPQTEAEGTPIQQRLEAKLDLILHWLGEVQASQHAPLAGRSLQLGLDGISWVEEDGLPSLATDQPVWLTLRPHPGLPGTLHLPARLNVEAVAAGTRLSARFSNPDADFMDAWNQWLFRLHRRAIQAARSGSTTA